MRFLVVLLIPFASGCVILPIPHPEYRVTASRLPIEPADVASLPVGTTSREDVLCTLGEPDFWWHDERVLVYHWTMSRVYVIVAAMGGGAAEDVPIERYLIVRLNAANHVEQHDFREAPLLVSGQKFLQQLKQETP